MPIQSLRFVTENPLSSPWHDWTTISLSSQAILNCFQVSGHMTSLSLSKNVGKLKGPFLEVCVKKNLPLLKIR
jgi:hypothetical protein